MPTMDRFARTRRILLMPTWDTLLRASLCGAYKYTGGMRLHEAVARWAGQQFLTILLFHRVTDAVPDDVLTVGAARFTRICRLLRNSFRVVRLDEIHKLLRSGQPLPPRTLAITFDDCYQDNLAAARVLAEHGLPATFFIPTAFVSTDRVFDWDRGLPRLPNLSWQEVREIARLGHEIGSHTVTHANLGAVGPDQARTELSASRTLLQEQIGQPIRWFAYPFGGPHHLRPEYVPLITEVGYEGAYSAFGSHIEPGADLRILPRRAVPPFRSVFHLEAYLSGCLRVFHALRNVPAESFPFGPADQPRADADQASLCVTGPG